MRTAILFCFFSLLVCGQTINDTIDSRLPMPDFRPTQILNSSRSYAFCDDNGDGILPFDIAQINSTALNENVSLIGFQSGIYLCTSYSNVYLVNNINTSPQINLNCHVSLPGFATTDIATNLNNEIFISKENGIYKIDDSTCQVLGSYNYNIGSSSTITSLSFDTDNNLYFGGFNTSVYRASGDYSTYVNWHDFGSGSAAGDFVICNGKMYIAWKLNGSCKLYEVIVDSNYNYVSHIVLGELPNPTYGLASELGKLYGVNPNFLYEINLNPLSFNTILQNTSNEDWYGSAGRNEGVSYSVSAFETLANAQNNLDPLPDSWNNTVPGGQTIYVVIRNLITNQSQILPMDLIVNFPSGYTIPDPLIHCSNQANPGHFDLRATESLIIGSHSNLIVSYHSTLADAQNNTNALPDQYTISTDSMDIYVRLTDTNTGCSAYFPFVVMISQSPVFTQPDETISCTKPDESIYREVPLQEQGNSILAGLNLNDYSVSFFHSSQEAALGTNPIAIPYFTSLSQEEIFFRVADVRTGCWSIGSFMNKILEESHKFATGLNIETSDWTSNQNSISAAVLGEQQYEYSLDGTNYISKGYFFSLMPGVYDVYVRNTRDCGVFSTEICLLNYPAFFTPNNDGYNDFWKIDFSDYEPEIKIYIYDRFGKLVAEVDPQTSGWDGYSDNRLLPSSDYWFCVKRKGKSEYRGHFSLKR